MLAVSAGVYEFGTLGEITEEHFDKMFNTDVRGLLFTVQKALPLLSKGSSVILTGSMVSIKGFASCSVYDATKAAIRSFARGWIVDLKGRDIRVNVLSPGYTATPGLSHFMTEEDKASAVASVPLGRIGTPDDLGKAAVFLASDDNAYITGIELFVDGGAAQICVSASGGVLRQSLIDQQRRVMSDGTRKLRFGLWYDFRNPPQWRQPSDRLYREILDQIAWAENNGFDDVWLSEHHFIEDGYLPSILPVAAAIAARTNRIRIGVTLMFWNSKNSLLKVTVSPASARRIISRDWLVRAPRSLKGTPKPSNSSRLKPIPTPSSKRPPEMTSTVAMSSARRTGL